MGFKSLGEVPTSVLEAMADRIEQILRTDYLLYEEQLEHLEEELDRIVDEICRRKLNL